MSIRIAQVERTHSSIADVIRPVQDAPVREQDDEDERPMRAARGIVSAILISVPFWALLGFAVYLLR